MKHLSMKTAFLAILLPLLATAALLIVPNPAWSAPGDIRLSKGQTVYVPVYSNVFSGPRKRPLLLATTLSIRNTDMSAAFTVTTIDYYDTGGKLIRRHLERSVKVAPLATHYVHLEEKDTAGGFGAKFIVRWQADKEINVPVIECVMIGATGGQGISFVSPGQEVRE